ncbi:MAG: DUF6717 family protein [Pirellulales bacterium]
MSTPLATLTLYPYLHDSCWVFDDERTGLKEEAFVLGVTEMITRVIVGKGIPNAEQGFSLTFAAEPFAGHDAELRWLRPDPAGGNWYESEVLGQRMEGWLCPALLLYFTEPPPQIFIRCDPLPSGIDPIWTPPPGVTGRRFVEAPPSGTVDRPGVPQRENPSREERKTVQRFDIPAKKTMIEMFRAFRGYLERTLEAKGKKLDPAWYEDSPEQSPGLYKDQPHLLNKGAQDDAHPEEKR